MVDLLTRTACASIVLAAAVAWSVGARPAGEDWTRFRGPNGSGISSSENLPLTFGPDEHVVWKTALPFGHSSPILAGERIYLTAARDERLVTIALDRRSGKILGR